MFRAVKSVVSTVREQVTQKGNESGSRKRKSQRTTGVNRRSILSSLGVGIGGIAASTAFSSSATATSDIDQETKEELMTIAEEYSSSEAVREAIESHAQELLEQLSQRGVLESESVDSLPTGSILSKEEFPNVTDGVTVVGLLAESSPTAHIIVKKSLGSQDLTLVVEPHVERSFARVSGGDDMIEIVSGQTNVGTTATCTCYTGTACIVSCHTSDGCSCAPYEVECCPDCCECNIWSQVTGGCETCYSDCWEATSCSC